MPTDDLDKRSLDNYITGHYGEDQFTTRGQRFSPLTVKQHPVQFLVVTAEPRAEDNLSNYAWYTDSTLAIEEFQRRVNEIKESQSDDTYEVLFFKLAEVQPRTMLEWESPDYREWITTITSRNRNT